MRLAVVGTHGSGKTTLVEALLAALPGYGHEPEPYYDLLDRGVAFSDPPDFDDYVEQVRASVAIINMRASEPDIVFDRCPLDLVAYAEMVGEPEGQVVPSRLMEAAETAVRTLNLIVFLPVSRPDEIAARADYPRLRAGVDRRLKEMLRSDEWELFGDGPKLLELKGPPERRLAALLRAIGR